MDDLVRRKDVIDTLHGLAHRFEDPEDWCILEGEAEFVVSKLPSAQPERNKGQWVDLGHDNLYKCSACGDIWMGIGGYNFCPSCGADMRGELNG